MCAQIYAFSVENIRKCLNFTSFVNNFVNVSQGICSLFSIIITHSYFYTVFCNNFLLQDALDPSNESVIGSGRVVGRSKALCPKTTRSTIGRSTALCPTTVCSMTTYGPRYQHQLHWPLVIVILEQ